MSPRHPCVIVVGDTKALDPASAIRADTGIWGPPGGWEDLVLGREAESSLGRALTSGCRHFQRRYSKPHKARHLGPP